MTQVIDRRFVDCYSPFVASEYEFNLHSAAALISHAITEPHIQHTFLLVHIYVIDILGDVRASCERVRQVISDEVSCVRKSWSYFKD